MYSILIGSYARGTADDFSDIDIVRISHVNSVPLPENFSSRAFISYIDYTEEEFQSLYSKGSLFLKHMFCEGCLLEGDITKWKKLSSNFVIQPDFNDEIKENLKVLNFILSNKSHVERVVPFLLHTFKCLKNISIFTLANQQKYVFDKRCSIRSVFPSISLIDLESMILSEQILERRNFESDELPVLHLMTCAASIYESLTQLS